MNVELIVLFLNNFIATRKISYEMMELFAVLIIIAYAIIFIAQP